MPKGNKPGYKPKHNPSGTKWKLKYLKNRHGKQRALEMLGLSQPTKIITGPMESMADGIIAMPGIKNEQD